MNNSGSELDLGVLAGRNITLPSPPAVAVKIIELANDEAVTALDIQRLIETDPALTAKVLRTANSPLYRSLVEIESLKQAIVVIGIGATLNLALSFSLLERLQEEGKNSGLDHKYFWRRVYLAAIAAKVVGEACHERALEELFLAALLQDIGMLAFSKIEPEAYDELGDRLYDHHAVIDYERDRFGVDHAAVGAFLLREWQIPQRLVEAVGHSHDTGPAAGGENSAMFMACVAFSGYVADIFAVPHVGASQYEALEKAGMQLLGLKAERLTRLIDQVGVLIPDMEALYSTRLTHQCSPYDILVQARDVLSERNLAALQQVKSLKEAAEQLQQRLNAMERLNYRDDMTGAYNQRYLQDYLPGVFELSCGSRQPLCVIRVAIDRFQALMAEHGRAAELSLLNILSRRLAGVLRDEDAVIRFGTEQFVVVLPGLGLEAVRAVIDRLMHVLQQSVTLSGDIKLKMEVTASLGVVVMESDADGYDSLVDMLDAADNALEQAKMAGGGQAVFLHEMTASAPSAY